MSWPWLWVPVTLLAAWAQVMRNSAQAGLTEKIGTLGATQVRFVFGLPFAVAFLALTLAMAGEPLPALRPETWYWAVGGALGQIAATALMLLVMRQKAFGLAYVYIKTEPVVVALFGALVLGDHLSGMGWLAVALVTLGVLMAAVKPADWRMIFSEGKSAGIGVTAGALFGMSVVCFRGAIESVPDASALIRSMTVLVVILGLQTLLLGLYLAVFDRQAFLGSLREWRGSLGAGGLGAVASAGWFVAVSLTAAANVRSLGLVEIPMAAWMSSRVSGRKIKRHEAWGFIVIAVGVACLVAGNRVVG